MPTTFGQANIAFGGALFTFGEFSVAYELSLVTDVGGRYKRKQLYDEMFKKDPVKKKKVIELILKVNSDGTGFITLCPRFLAIILPSLSIKTKYSECKNPPGANESALTLTK